MKFKILALLGVCILGLLVFQAASAFRNCDSDCLSYPGYVTCSPRFERLGWYSPFERFRREHFTPQQRRRR
jgi:hypothetical protein